MTMYGIPDITGQNPDYLQINVPFNIYQSGIKIAFENSPIFTSSLVITLVDGSGSTLDENVDWVVNSDDIDQTAMSRAFLQNPNFTGILAKSVTIASNKALHKTVAMNFQEFYLTLPGRSFGDGTPFEVTPDLIQSLVSSVASLQQRMAGVNSPISSNLIAPSLLPFDINGTLSSNVITGEVVSINTIAGIKVIRLEQGSFFKDSLTLTFNGTPLNPASDYTPIGLSPLTNQSTNKSGIYKYIQINATISGSVTVGYHAVGGDVQINDIESTYSLMLAIRDFLDTGGFITPENISQTPAVLSQSARINILEDEMRRLLAGAPTYGDATAGAVAVRPVQAVDSNFHWWTIATLYQVAGSTSVVTADRFRGRVYLPGAGVSLTFTVDVNLEATRNKVSFTTESVVFDPLYQLFGSVSVAAPVYPLIRVVWNQSGSAFSGAALQFGIPLTALTDTMTVEDMSTTESCWLLDTHGIAINGNAATESSPNDTSFTLPDGVSTWASGSGISFSETFVPVFEDGYLIYQGSSVNLAAINTTSTTSGLFNSVLPYYFPVDNVREIAVTILSSTSTTVYDVVVPVSSIVTGIKMGRMLFTASTGELVELSVNLAQETGGNSLISLNIIDNSTSIWTNAGTTFTDVIRYIRARV